VEPRRGANRCPLTLSLSREGRGDLVSEVVQSGCCAFHPLPRGDKFAGSEFGRPEGGPEGASLRDEASKGPG